MGVMVSYYFVNTTKGVVDMIFFVYGLRVIHWYAIAYNPSVCVRMMLRAGQVFLFVSFLLGQVIRDTFSPI
jgi:hypothetical protein